VDDGQSKKQGFDSRSTLCEGHELMRVIKDVKDGYIYFSDFIRTGSGNPAGNYVWFQFKVKIDGTEEAIRL